MYISNSTNIGMATLLHNNNKSCLKAHTNVNVNNVNNIREMSVMPSNNIVGNAISGTITTTAVPVCNASTHHHHPQQVVANLVSSAGGVNTARGIVSTEVTSSGGGGSGRNGSSTVGSGTVTATSTNNILLPPPAQAVLITNNATGASSILTYQQYQQNLLHQQPHQRLLITPNLVSLPISNLVSTSGADLAVITSNSAQHLNNMPITLTNSTTAITNHNNNNINSQNAIVTSSSNVNNITTPINSFQQQFQQQIAVNVTHSGQTNMRSILSMQQQQQPHHHQQQQKQQSMLAVTHNKINSNNGNHRQNAIVINRSNTNTIVGNNVKQCLSNATILAKSISNIQRSTMLQQQPQQSPIIVNNIALQQMVNGGSGGQTQLVNVVKGVSTMTNPPIVAIAGAAVTASPIVTSITSTSSMSPISESHKRQKQQQQQRTKCGVLSLPHIKQYTSLPSSVSSIMPSQLSLSPSPSLQVQSQQQQQQQHQQQQHYHQQMNKVGPKCDQRSCITNRKGKTISSIQQPQQQKQPQQQQQQQLTNRTLLGKTPLLNGHQINASNSSKTVNTLSSNTNDNTTTTAITGNKINKSNDGMTTIMTTRSTAATLLTLSSTKNNTDGRILNNSASNNSNTYTNANIVNTTTITTTTMPTTTTVKTTITKTKTTLSTTSTTIAIGTTATIATSNNDNNNNTNKTNNDNDSNKISKNNENINVNNSISNIINVNSSSSPISSISCYNSIEVPLNNAVNNSNNNNCKSSSINIPEMKDNATVTTITAAATTTTAIAATDAATDQEVEPEIDIVINNVVCSFSVRCHLNLREIALRGSNVEYRRENGMVTMKLRRPYTTASIWSSGRVTCTGATSEEQAKIAGRRYARCLQTLGFKVRFQNFRVVNVLGTCSMPWAIKIVNFSEKYKREASYEPELHPGVTYKLRFPKATLKIFSTGSITVTAASVLNVQTAIEHIYPLVYEFRKKRSPEEMELLRQKQQLNAGLLDITENDNDLVVVSDTNDSHNANDAKDGNGNNENLSLNLKRRNDEYSKSIKKQCFNSIDTKYHFNNTSATKKATSYNSIIAASNVGHNDATIKNLKLLNNNALYENDPENLIVNDEDLIAYDPNDLIEGPDEEDVNE